MRPQKLSLFCSYAKVSFLIFHTPRFSYPHSSHFSFSTILISTLFISTLRTPDSAFSITTKVERKQYESDSAARYQILLLRSTGLRLSLTGNIPGFIY